MQKGNRLNMNGSAADSFSRYLSAKKSVDDRSINLFVYQKMIGALGPGCRTAPLNILELGCGLGAMLERLWDWRLTGQAAYTGVDRDPELIAAAGVRLEQFARQRRLAFSAVGEAGRLQGAGRDWLITFKPSDGVRFCREEIAPHRQDLLLAHAFLDLVDLPVALPCLLSSLRPGGVYYFTLTFDGGTIFHPPVDPEFEDLMITLYHRSMDEREGGQGGHSQAGRRLLAALGQIGADILAAGSSDWLVLPKGGSYPAEEAFFLHFLLETIRRALAGHPDLEQERFQNWLHRRREQIQAGELIFMAHQLDVCGRV